MASAMSPRNPPPRLKRTEDKPRKEQSDEQKKAVCRGMTLRAGPITKSRLHRGVQQVNFKE